jgi:hypothetical protein
VTHQTHCEFDKNNNGVLGFNITLFFYELFTSFSCSLSGSLKQILMQDSQQNHPFPVLHELFKYRENGSVLGFTKCGYMKSITNEARTAIDVSSLVKNFMRPHFGKSNIQPVS